MNVATKSAILLAATLAFGVVLGLVGAGALERARNGPPPGGPRPPGFANHMEEAIQPRDSSQAAQIRPIIARAAERNRAMISNANVALRQSVDSMKAELLPLLDDAQRDRLDRATRALPPIGLPGGRGGRGRGGPPEGPPPLGPPREGGPP